MRVKFNDAEVVLKKSPSRRYGRHLHIMITDEMHEFIKNNLRSEIAHRVRQMLLIYMGKASRAEKELFINEILGAKSKN